MSEVSAALTEPADEASAVANGGAEVAPPSLGKRVGNWKTLLSFGLAIGVLVFVIIKGGFNPEQIWSRLHTANWGYFVLGGLVYYSTFPLRGFRWRLLLENAYRDAEDARIADMHVSGLTEIIFISWFVNCVVPAKLGDLYRAYLAKLWQHISWVKTVGTVLAERIVDIIILALLLAGSGLLAFHTKLGSIKFILAFGLVLGVAGLAALLIMKHSSRLIRARVPERYRLRYAAFEEGTLMSLRRLPLLFIVTVPIWLLEGVRLMCMFAALHLDPSSITAFPYAAMLFFALGTAVLTTIPFTPGGLGLVETGLAGVMILLGIHRQDAGAVVFMDRLLSYYSIALVGFIVYLVSKRSHFRHA